MSTPATEMNGINYVSPRSWLSTSHFCLVRNVWAFSSVGLVLSVSARCIFTGIILVFPGHVHSSGLHRHVYRFLYGDQGMLGIVISTEKVHGYTGLGSGQRVQGSRSRYR